VNVDDNLENSRNGHLPSNNVDVKNKSSHNFKDKTNEDDKNGSNNIMDVNNVTTKDNNGNNVTTKDNNDNNVTTKDNNGNDPSLNSPEDMIPRKSAFV